MRKVISIGEKKKKSYPLEKKNQHNSVLIGKKFGNSREKLRILFSIKNGIIVIFMVFFNRYDLIL